MASKVVGNLIVNLAANIASFESSMRQAAKVSERRTKQMQKTLQGVEKRLNGFASTAQVAFAAIGSGVALRSIVNASIQMERINNALRVATGSSDAAATEFAYVRAEAKRLGLDLATSAEQYSRLAAAARGTALQGQETRDIFTAVSEASTVLGLSAEQTGGALNAIEQIISKGKVSAEELRGQLGERLPGAFQIAARAMGVTTAELDKMLSTGKLTAEELLPRLADELRRTFGAEVATAANGTQQAINRMNTALFEFKNQLADGGVIAGFTNIVSGVGSVLSQVRPFFIAWAALIKERIEQIRFTFDFAITAVVGLWQVAFNKIAAAFAAFLAKFRDGITSMKAMAAQVGAGLQRVPGFAAAGGALLSFGASGTPGLDAAIQKLEGVGSTAEDVQRRLAGVAAKHRENIGLIQDTATAMIAENMGIGENIAPAIEEAGETITTTLDATSGKVDEVAADAGQAFDPLKYAAEGAAQSMQASLADFFYNMGKDTDDMLANFLDALHRMTSQLLAFQVLKATPLGSFLPTPGHAALGGIHSGPTIVGEHGPELLNLPRMTHVTPNSKLGGTTVVVNQDNRASPTPAEWMAFGERLRGQILNDIVRMQNGYAPA